MLDVQTSSQIVTISKPTSKGRMPFLSPNQQCRSTTFCCYWKIREICNDRGYWHQKADDRLGDLLPTVHPGAVSGQKRGWKTPKRTPWQCNASVRVAVVYCWGWPWGKQVRGMWSSVRPVLSYVFLERVYYIDRFLLGTFHLLYIITVFCVFVVLVQSSVLAMWLARKTSLRTPIPVKEIISTKTRLRSVSTCFRFYVVCFPGPTRYISYFYCTIYTVCADNAIKHQPTNRV